MNCNEKYCNKEATCRVGITLRTIKGHFLRETHPKKYFCEDHSKNLKWRQVISEEEWAGIVKGSRRRGMGSPAKGKSEIYVEPLNDTYD